MSSTNQLPEIPLTAITKDKQEITLGRESWRIRLDPKLDKTVVLNWNTLRTVCMPATNLRIFSDRAVHLFMLYIALTLPRLKASTAMGVYRAALGFSRWLSVKHQWLPIGRSFDWSDLTEDIFRAWLHAESKSASGGLLPTTLRQFYRWGAEADALYPYFSSELARTLDNIRISSHLTGEVVRSRDKRRGPFNREELELILDACKSQKGRDRDRALVWVLFDTAARPTQLALLRNRDLQVFEEFNEAERGGANNDSDGFAYQLKVPIIKQRRPGYQYRPLPISPECGRLLERLRKPGSGLDDPLFWWFRKDYHTNILYSLRRFFKDVDLRSPRLPIGIPAAGGPFYEIIPVTPRRFRYAMASGRIAWGDSPESVSDFLCQTDTSSLASYVETSPLIADVFQRATDHAVMPLVSKMQGRLDDPSNPSDAPLIPAVVPQVSSGRELRVIGTIGKCGSADHCPRNPVTGCFGCPSFIARPDAPLRELREAILEDLKADLAKGASPLVIEQFRSTINELDQWIEHIERAKAFGPKQQAREKE